METLIRISTNNTNKMQTNHLNNNGKTVESKVRHHNCNKNNLQNNGYGYHKTV